MNLILSVDEELVERARETARQQGTSLNALIRKYIESLAGKKTGEEIAREFREMWESGPQGDSGGQRFRREDAYDPRRIGG